MRVVTLAIVTAIAVSLTASTALSAPKKPSIKDEDGLSHYHPKDSDSSDICVKLKGKPGQKIRVQLVFGAGDVLEDDEFKLPGKTAKKKKRGKLLLSFEIFSAGPYEFLVGKSDADQASDSADYVVPPPPPDGAKMGPFKCPGKTVTKGWG
ncbi:MAG TPA: hypothetical protein VD790_04745 [Thermoleophilaceae bacterium]|nr:hypothetical protein [Thermoleophilaceae bacterium]